MSVETKHEEESQVMGIPECLEALSTDFVMGGGIHENNDEEHEVASYTAWLMVVDLDCRLLPELCNVRYK